MKKYIMVAIMICFVTANISFTAFAEGNRNIEIRKKILQQQKEVDMIQCHMFKQAKQKSVAPEDYIPVLMYHHFETGEVEAGNGVIVNIAEFEEQIKALQQAGYTTIFLSELYYIMQQSKIEKEKGVKQPELHLNKKYVVITIDDGYKSNYELVYPILQKYNMKANISVITSLICTDFVCSPEGIERMSWENLNEMQNSGLVEIYNHRYDHKPVGDRTYADVCSSVIKGEEMLDKYLQKRSLVKVLTYPNGNYRKDIALSMQSDIEYDLQLTTDIYVVNRDTSMWEVPRITVDAGWTGEELLQNIENTAIKTFYQKKRFVFTPYRLKVISIVGLAVLAIVFIIVKVRNKKII